MSLEDFGSRIPVLNGLFGWESDAEKDLQAQLGQLKQIYEKYRANNADMRQSQLGTQLQAWAPVQQYLGQMLPGISSVNAQQVMNAFGTAAAGLRSGVTGGQGPAALGGQAAVTGGPYVPTGNFDWNTRTREPADPIQAAALAQQNQGAYDWKTRTRKGP